MIKASSEGRGRSLEKGGGLGAVACATSTRRQRPRCTGARRCSVSAPPAQNSARQRAPPPSRDASPPLRRQIKIIDHLSGFTGSLIPVQRLQWDNITYTQIPYIVTI